MPAVPARCGAISFRSFRSSTNNCEGNGHSCVLLEYDGRLHAHREARNAVHRVVDVLQRLVRYIGGDGLDGDAAGVVADGFDLIQPRNTFEVLLDLYNPLNFLGRGPGYTTCTWMVLEATSGKKLERRLFKPTKPAAKMAIMSKSPVKLYLTK